MINLRKYIFFFLFVGSLTASAGAQIRFNVNSNPYAGPGLNISVGNSGYCQQPVYNTGYAVYPVNNGRRHRRGRGQVVVTPVYSNQGYYNQGYNQGYYNQGYNNGYYVNNNNGYYNNGYNQGYYNPGYGQYNQGYNNNGRCR